MANITLFLTLLLYVFVFEPHGGKCEPDITLLGRKLNNDYKYTCIIGNNESDTSVAFLTPLSVTYLQIASEYRTPDGTSLSDEFNCDFENECSKRFENNGWETVLSENHLLPIADDIRFEHLETYRTRGGQIPFEISDQNFYFPISLRAEEPQILLCTDDSENIIHCYWIKIEKYENIYEVAIRDCAKVNKAYFSIKDSSCILISSIEHKTNLMRDMDWFHYIVMRHGNTLIFKDASTNEEYIRLENVKEDFKKIYVKMSTGKRGEWKIHKNSYLKLKTFDSEVQLGSTFSSNNDDNFCISMMVSICQGCSFQISINNETTEKLKGNSDIWRNIKLTAVSKQTKEFKIFVKGTRSNHSDIIAIDNIRLCHKHEMRILTINNKLMIPSISCKALSFPKWYSTLNYNSYSSTSEICEDAKYIGKNCNIPCSAVLGPGSDMEFCNKHFICKPTENYNVQNCGCAAGYTGRNCDETCSSHKFGYNCQKQCGQCKDNDSCLKSSGICYKGCESEFVSDSCIYKRFEPVNLSSTVDENGQVKLNWEHPKGNESVTKYLIIASLLVSDIPNNSKIIKEDVSFTRRQENYSYTLQKQVPLSSSYTIKVCGNKIMTHCANTTLVTFPVKPMLTKDFITVEDNYNNTKLIKIPGIVPETKCAISYMYVSVCVLSTIGTNENNSTISEKINCEGISWIAAKIETSTSEVTFKIGEGNKSSNSYNNSPLEYNNRYNISVLLINEYKNKTSYNVYCEENDHDSVTKLVLGGILIVVLIIFAIVVCVLYRKQRKQNRYEEQIDNIEEIPLQTAVNEDCEQSCKAKERHMEETQQNL